MNHSGKNSNIRKWMIFYHPLIKQDMEVFDGKTVERIKLAIENKLSVNPLFYGSSLHGALKRYFKLRVGDARVIYSVFPKGVFILVIANRKDVYRITANRLSYFELQNSMK